MLLIFVCVCDIILIGAGSSKKTQKVTAKAGGAAVRSKSTRSLNSQSFNAEMIAEVGGSFTRTKSTRKLRIDDEGKAPVGAKKNRVRKPFVTHIFIYYLPLQVP